MVSWFIGYEPTTVWNNLLYKYFQIDNMALEVWNIKDSKLGKKLILQMSVCLCKDSSHFSLVLSRRKEKCFPFFLFQTSESNPIQRYTNAKAIAVYGPYFISLQPSPLPLSPGSRLQLKRGKGKRNLLFALWFYPNPRNYNWPLRGREKAVKAKCTELFNFFSESE